MEQTHYTNVIKPFYKLHARFIYHQIDVSVRIGDDLPVTGWIGAELRNHFLFACEGVKIAGGIRLRQVFEELSTISNQHPLYDELKNVFTRGYGLFPDITEPGRWNRPYRKGDILNFSIVLYGHCKDFGEATLQALFRMCRNGLQRGNVPLQLLSVSERQEDGSRYVFYNEEGEQPFRLQNPVTLGRYIHSKMEKEEQRINILYDTPVNLYGGRLKLYKPGYGYRDHQFPGFHRLVLCAASRVARLTALYTFPDQWDFIREAEQLIDRFAEPAASMLLSAAHVQRVDFSGPSRKGTDAPIRLSGYTGSAEFMGNCNYYLPLLLFVREIGVGKHTTYGFGRYRITK